VTQDTETSELPPAPGPLDRPLSSAGIPGLSAAIAGKMAKGLGLRTIRDLLEHVPRRYIDLSTTKQIRDLKIGEEATTQGTVVRVDGRYLRSRKHLLTVTIKDETGSLSLVWWNQAFRTKSFAQGQRLVVAGRLDRNRGQIAITNPFFETLKSGRDQIHTGRVIPVHSTTQGVSTKQIRSFVHGALERYGAQVSEPLPAEVVAGRGLMSRTDALREVHFPTSDKRMRAARHRLVFEELFVLSSGLAIRKHRLETTADGIAHGDVSDVDPFLSSLPFRPTREIGRAHV